MNDEFFLFLSAMSSSLGVSMSFAEGIIVPVQSRDVKHPDLAFMLYDN